MSELIIEPIEKYGLNISAESKNKPLFSKIGVIEPEEKEEPSSTLHQQPEWMWFLWMNRKSASIMYWTS